MVSQPLGQTPCMQHSARLARRHRLDDPVAPKDREKEAQNRPKMMRSARLKKGSAEKSTWCVWKVWFALYCMVLAARKWRGTDLRSTYSAAGTSDLDRPTMRLPRDSTERGQPPCSAGLAESDLSLLATLHNHHTPLVIGCVCVCVWGGGVANIHDRAR